VVVGAVPASNRRGRLGPCDGQLPDGVTRSQTNQLLNGTQGSAPGRAHSSGGKRLVLRRAVSSALNRRGAVRYFLVSAAAKNRSSDSTSPGSVTVSAISCRKSSRYLLRSL
jgi:hypothetical protein